MNLLAEGPAERKCLAVTMTTPREASVLSIPLSGPSRELSICLGGVFSRLAACMLHHQAGCEELSGEGGLGGQGGGSQTTFPTTLIIGKPQVPPQSISASLIIDDLICLSTALPSTSS